MTVISALITKHGTAHASDSFITKVKRNGGVEVINTQQTKLVYVKPWRGAFAYWGLAQFKNWSTLEWLRERARIAGEFSTPEEFAKAAAVDLNGELARFPISKPSDKGIGIHFTAYEWLDNRWIPELFLISNWEGIPYTKIRSTGVGASRETYHTLKNIPSSPEHGKLEFRLAVHEALQTGTLFYYNNGDPELFNPIAKAMFDSMNALSQRSVLVDLTTAKAHCNLVRRPIEVVSRLLVDFTKKERRIIGGRPHDLCVLSNGNCWSSTGDGHG